jgi:hypothetical protein
VGGLGDDVSRPGGGGRHGAAGVRCEDELLHLRGAAGCRSGFPFPFLETGIRGDQPLYFRFRRGAPRPLPLVPRRRLPALGVRRPRRCPW